MAAPEKKQDIKKTKKSKITEKAPVETESAQDEVTEDVHEGVSDGSITWPTDDIKILISRMYEEIPSDDRLKHMVRAAKLPWDKISFDNYTADECQKMWHLILQRIRGFRLLSEVLEDAKVWAEHPQKSFWQTSKLRNSAKPKKSRSAYLIHNGDYLKELRKQYPTEKLVKLFPMMSEHYHTLTPAEKLKYEKRAELEKQEYQRKMKKFLEENPDMEISTKKQKPPSKITAYKVYVEAQMQKKAYANKPLKEMLPKLRQKWDELPEAKKLPWLDQAEKKGELLNDSNLCHLTKKEKLMRERAAGKPPKPPQNIYSMFTKKLLISEEIQKVFHKDRMKEVGSLWKNVDEKEKEKLTKQLMKEHEEYKVAYSLYLETLDPEERRLEEEQNVPKKRKPPTKPDAPSPKKGRNSAGEEDSNTENNDKLARDQTDGSLKSKNNKNVKFNNDKLNDHNESHDILDANNHSPKKKDKSKRNKSNISDSPSYSDNHLEDITGSPPKSKNNKSVKFDDNQPMDHDESYIDQDQTGGSLKIKNTKNKKVNDSQSTDYDDSYSTQDECNLSPKKKKKNKKNKQSDQSPSVHESQLEDESDQSHKKKKKNKSASFNDSESTDLNDSSTPKSKKKRSKEEDEASEQTMDDSCEGSFITKSRFTGEPKLPPILPIKLFAKTVKKTQRIKFKTEDELNEAWNNLAPKERKSYKKALKEANENYKIEYSTFLNSLSKSDLDKYLSFKNSN